MPLTSQLGSGLALEQSPTSSPQSRSNNHTNLRQLGRHHLLFKAICATIESKKNHEADSRDHHHH